MVAHLHHLWSAGKPVRKLKIHLHSEWHRQRSRKLEARLKGTVVLMLSCIVYISIVCTVYRLCSL